MRARAALLAGLLAASLGGQAAGGRVLDRIAAVVNGTPILASEVRDAARFARWSAGAAAETPLTAGELTAALQHLEDEQLLDQERTDEGYGEAPSAAVQRQWEVMAQRAGGAAALAAALGRYGLAPETAQAILRRQLTLLDFLDQHFSGALIVTDAAVEGYYDQDFVPAARREGKTPAALEAVRGEITRILRQRELEQNEETWLRQLRAAAAILVEPQGLATNGSGRE